MFRRYFELLFYEVMKRLISDYDKHEFNEELFLVQKYFEI